VDFGLAFKSIPERPVFTAWAERLPWGRGFKVHFSRLETPLDGTPTEQAQAINAAMEALIANNPAQYLWSYNRYKQPSAQRSLRKEPAPSQ